MKAAIEEANGGKVDVVLEMVGGSTFDGSLAALAPFGRLVFFGMAGRERPSPVDPAQLHAEEPLRGRLLARALHAPARRCWPSPSGAARHGRRG